jgi:hypothetical protein
VTRVIDRTLGIAAVAGVGLVAACGAQRHTIAVSASSNESANGSPASVTVEAGHVDTGVNAQVGFSAPARDANADAERVPAEDIMAIHKLLVALQANDRVAVSRLLAYSNLVEGVANAADFIRLYDNFFDAETIPEVIQACKSPPWHNWRGTSIGHGQVWIFGGKILSINVETDKLRRMRAEAKAADALTLHPSVRNYQRVLVDCETKHDHVRVHEESATVRYIAWKGGASLTSAPELSLAGECELSSGGDRDCFFKQKASTYEVDIAGLCSGSGDDCLPTVTVTEGGRIRVDEVCRTTLAP